MFVHLGEVSEGNHIMELMFIFYIKFVWERILISFLNKC